MTLIRTSSTRKTSPLIMSSFSVSFPWVCDWHISLRKSVVNFEAYSLKVFEYRTHLNRYQTLIYWSERWGICGGTHWYNSCHLSSMTIRQLCTVQVYSVWKDTLSHKFVLFSIHSTNDSIPLMIFSMSSWIFCPFSLISIINSLPDICSLLSF